MATEKGKWGFALAVGIVAVLLLFGYVVHGMNNLHREQKKQIHNLELNLRGCEDGLDSQVDTEQHWLDSIQSQLDQANAKLDTIGHKLMANEVANQLRVKR